MLEVAAGIRMTLMLILDIDLRGDRSREGAGNEAEQMQRHRGPGKLVTPGCGEGLCSHILTCAGGVQHTSLCLALSGGQR